MAPDLLENFYKVDGVEIDGKVVEVAEKYFGYDPFNERIKIYVTDGRNYLRSSSEKYDVIILDAFSGVSPVSHLHTKEAFAEMKEGLTGGGLLIINTIGYSYGEKAKLQRSLYKTLSEIFPEVIAMSTEGTDESSNGIGNIIFVASSREIDFPFGEEFLVKYEEDSLNNEIVLSDSRNPIELLGIPIFEESRESYRKFLTVQL